MTPHRGNTYFLLFLPATPLSPSRTLEWFFDLTRRPPRALNSPRPLIPELHKIKYTVRCARLGVEGRRAQDTVKNY